MRHAALLLLLGLIGCIENRRVLLEELADGGPAARRSELFIQGQQQLDLLFVIDNSSGMAGAQALLARSLGQLLGELEDAGASWRLGVISTDLGIAPFAGPGCDRPGGDGAELQGRGRLAGCADLAPPYLERGQLTDPGEAFACIASLGEGGCGFERPLASALEALGPGGSAARHGFRRAEAGLIVVWLANEDDCSAADSRLYDPDDISLGPWGSHRCFAQDIACAGTAPDGSLTGCAPGQGAFLHPLEEVATALRGLAAPGPLLALAVVGPVAPVRLAGSGAEVGLEPSCSSGVVAARPGIRFHRLIELLGADGATLSICDDDLGAQLAAAVRRPRIVTPHHCLRHSLRDPSRPACAVEATSPEGRSWRVPSGAPGVPGFRLIHPLDLECGRGAIAFDEDARPPAGSAVRVTCDFAP